MALLHAPHPRDLTDEQWNFIDPVLPELARRKDGRGRKQGGASIGKTKRGKGSKIMAIADRQGLPLAVHVESATPHEVRLVHTTLAERFVRQLTERLIGDNAYESDILDAELARLA